MAKARDEARLPSGAREVTMAESHDDPVIRLATLDDAPAMVRVIESAFDRWPPFEIETSAVDHLRWKMAAPGPAAHSVVEVDGEIVGASVRWVSQIQVGDEVYEQDSAVDQAILSTMQGRGLGGKLVAFAHGEAAGSSDMALGSGSNNPAMAGLFDRVDPTLVEYPLRVWTRPFGPRAFLGRHRVAGAGHLVRAVALRGRRVRSAAVSPGARIERVSDFDERVDALWASMAPSFEVSVVRSREWLNWRHSDARAGRAVILTAEDGDGLLGYVVAKRSGRWAQILDLVYDPGHVAVGATLVERACREMRTEGASGVDCWLPPNDPLEPALRGAGLLDSGEVRPVGLGPQRRGRESDQLARLYAGEARVHLMAGDLELA